MSSPSSRLQAYHEPSFYCAQHAPSMWQLPEVSEC